MYIKKVKVKDPKVKDKVKIKIETDQSSIAIDSYTCEVKAKHKYFDGWKTVGQVSRYILGYIYFFTKNEGGRINDNVSSFNNKPLPILSGGLEVPLLLTFSCQRNRFKIK